MLGIERSQVICRLGQLTRGGDWRVPPPFRANIRQRDAPTAGDIRPRGSPDVASVRSPRAYSPRTSSSSPAAIICVEALRRVRCADARGRAGTSAAHDEFARQAAAWCAVCSSEIGSPGGGVHLERALDALRIVGMDARRRGRRRRRAGAHAARASPVARASRVDGGAQLGRCPRAASAMPPMSARRYSIVPPTSSGTRPRASMSSMARAASRTNCPAE